VLAPPSRTGDRSGVGAPEARHGLTRGPSVEFVRLIIVALFAAGGYTVAMQVSEPSTQRTLLGVVLGSGVGFVLCESFGRQTATAVSSPDREFRRVPQAEVVAGAAGVIVGLAIATLAAIPIVRPPSALAAWPVATFVCAVRVVARNVIRNATGRMLFASLQAGS